MSGSTSSSPPGRGRVSRGSSNRTRPPSCAGARSTPCRTRWSRTSCRCWRGCERVPPRRTPPSASSHPFEETLVTSDDTDLGPMPHPVIDPGEPNPGGVDALQDDSGPIAIPDLTADENPALDEKAPDTVKE